jgi:hypothetical protein
MDTNNQVENMHMNNQSINMSMKEQMVHMDKNIQGGNMDIQSFAEPLPSVSYREYILHPLLLVFSKIYAVSTWVFGLRWYNMLFMIIIGSVIFVLTESILEQRRENRRKRKEGMQSSSSSDPAELKSIMQKNKKSKTDNKKVTFQVDKPFDNILQHISHINFTNNL